MWIYEDMSLSSEPEEILAILRDHVKKERDMDLFGSIKRINGYVMFSCPFHKGGKEKKSSCGISLDKNNTLPKGMIHCFTCGSFMSFAEMISRVCGKTDSGLFGRQWLKSNFNFSTSQRREEVDFDRKFIFDKDEFIQEKDLKEYDVSCQYLYKRGITQEVMSLFHCGYDKKTHCVTFPVRDPKGRILFIARRSIVGKYFNYPSGAVKPIYGIYECEKYYNELPYIIVCESIINALTAWSYGYPAIALCGLGSKSQIENLKIVSSRVFVLAFDGDHWGRRGAEKLAKQLEFDKIIEFMVLPDGKDVNDLSEKEFGEIFNNRGSN